MVMASYELRTTLNHDYRLARAGFDDGRISRMTDGVNLYDDILRNVFFIITFFISVLFLLSGFPFALLFHDTVALRAGFRIAFGVVYATSLWKTREALPILFGHETVRRGYDRGLTEVLTYHLQFPLIGFLVFGIFTELTALALLVIRVLFIAKTKRFGLENTLYQMIIVHMPFLGVGAAYSVDAVLGITPTLASPILFNSLFVLVGIMTASGAYHKLGSEVWTSGEAVGRFLRLPHLRVAFLRNVTFSMPRRLSAVLSYSMIFAQFLLLFSLFNKWIFLSVCVVFLLFSMTLFLVMDLSFIGQTMALIFLLYGGTTALNLASYPAPSTLAVISVTPFTGFAVFMAILALLVVFQDRIVTDTPIRTLSRYLTGQNAPVKPFNEHHLRGVHNFRLIYEDPETGEQRPTLEVYDKEGWQQQFFHPRHYQVSGYIITDYCLAIQHDGMPEADRQSELLDICYAGLHAAGERDGNIYVQIKIFDGDLEAYLESDWQTLGVCRFEDGDPAWELLRDPPQFDDHPRLDFDFGNS
jgi:hypothetical protein